MMQMNTITVSDPFTTAARVGCIHIKELKKHASTQTHPCKIRRI
jgi:hypothetical protein